MEKNRDFSKLIIFEKIDYVIHILNILNVVGIRCSLFYLVENEPMIKMSTNKAGFGAKMAKLWPLAQTGPKLRKQVF